MCNLIFNGYSISLSFKDFSTSNKNFKNSLSIIDTIDNAFLILIVLTL